MSQTPEEKRPEPAPPSTDQLPAVLQPEYRKRRHGIPVPPAEALDEAVAPTDPSRASGQRAPAAVPLSWDGGAILAPDEDESTRRVRPEAGGQSPPQTPLPRVPAGDPLAGSLGAGSPPPLSPPARYQPPGAQRSPAPQAPAQPAPPGSGHQVGHAEPQDSLEPALDGVRIGLWGSTASGKTTFLAALRQAIAAASRRDFGMWNIIARNPQSADLLVRYADTLVNHREFPEPTVLNAVVELAWLFIGDIAGTKLDRRLLKRGSLESKFELDLIDVPGGAFADDPEKAGVGPTAAARAVDHLESAAGLIYLFDPIGERNNRNSSEFVNRTIVELQRRIAASGQARVHLPHHVAVCITKFDHPQVFQRARTLGLVNHGADGMPRVLDEHAEQFFDAICSGAFWGEQDEGGQASAQFVRDQLRAAFDPQHVRYYVTSSIGFRQPPRWTLSPAASAQFNPDDFANYYEKSDGHPGIRDAIRPINVLEPLIGLVRQLEKK